MAAIILKSNVKGTTSLTPGAVKRFLCWAVVSLSEMMQKMRRHFGNDVAKWPMPEGQDHSSLLLKEMILKLQGAVELSISRRRTLSLQNNSHSRRGSSDHRRSSHSRNRNPSNFGQHRLRNVSSRGAKNHRLSSWKKISLVKNYSVSLPAPSFSGEVLSPQDF